MLLLARINDRLRPEPAQYPVHAAELRRRYRENQYASSQFGFHCEFPLLLFTVVEQEIPDNSGGEIG